MVALLGMESNGVGAAAFNGSGHDCSDSNETGVYGVGDEGSISSVVMSMPGLVVLLRESAYSASIVYVGGVCGRFGVLFAVDEDS